MKTATPQSMLIHAASLSVGYEDFPLLKGISFQIKAGEKLGFYGSNGVGKSTLLRTLNGQHPKMGGNLVITVKPFFLATRLPFYADLTVEENLHFWQLLLKAPKDLLLSLKNQFHLQSLWFTPFKYLSDGQKQRVHLLLLPLSRSILWIMDEPARSLDEQGVELLVNLFKRHCETGGGLIFAQPGKKGLIEEARDGVDLSRHHYLRAGEEEGKPW